MNLMENNKKINIISGLCCFMAIFLHSLGIAGIKLNLLILSTPIFCFIANSFIDKEKFKKKYEIYIRKFERVELKINPLFCFWGLFFLSLFTWLLTYFHMFDRFNLGAFDSGIYGNIAFNTASGDPFYSSVLEKNHLGEHFSPVVTLFAPLYRIKADLRWLLAAQAISFSLVPIIIYRISNTYTNIKSEKFLVALFLSIIWLIYIPMRSAMIFPFHPSSMAAPFILLAFAYLIEGKIGRMLTTLIFLLFFKENLTLVLIGFSFYLFFQKKDYKKSIFLFILGATTLFLIVFIIIPVINGDIYSKLTRFGIFDDPVLKFKYIFSLFLPLGFLPIIFWRSGIIVFPVIMQNLIVNSQPMYSSEYHYDDLIAPLLFSILPGIIICYLLPLLNKFNLNKTILLSLSVFLLLTFYAKESPLQMVWSMPITEVQKGIKKELVSLKENYPNETLYFQQYLFPHINLPPSKAKVMCQIKDHLKCICFEPKTYPNNSILVFAKAVPKYPIKDLEKCISAYEKSEKAIKMTDFKYLTVFEINHKEEKK